MTREDAPGGFPGWWMLLILPALGALGALGVFWLAPEPEPASTPEARLSTPYPTPPPVRFETPTPRPTVPPTATVAPSVIGQSAADVVLDTLDGGTIRLADLRGQVVFLNFWATWCAPCREEMPALQQLYESSAGDVMVIALTDPTDGQSVEAIRAFVDTFGITFPVALSSDAAFYRRWTVQQIPTTFIIDRDGVVRRWHVGALHDHDIADFLAALANAAPDTADP